MRIPLSVVTIVAALGLGPLTGCEQPGVPGPMQRAGASIDNAALKVRQGVGDAGQAVHDKLSSGPSTGSPPPPPPATSTAY